MIFDSLLLALTLTDLWWWIVIIVKVALALGAVIFVHELGHFLVAKACGVKVEKFMIGFDIAGYKISRRWNETEYGIGILPLGGYVKMLGQDDDPAHIAEQMQKSQVDASSSNAKEITGPNGEKYYVDRRSYLAKSVPQRMAIISAGVIMNLIFAFIFAVIAYGMGVEYLPCIVSQTMPGSPAWQAGLQPGDEIVQLGDRPDPTFMQLKGGVTLGNLETGILCAVRRAEDDQVVPVTLKPSQESGELATVGLVGPQSLKLFDGYPVAENSAAANARLISPADNAQESAAAKLQSGDLVVSVNGVAVEKYREYVAELVKATDKPLELGVRRAISAAGDNSESGARSKVEQTELLTFEVPTQPLRDLGLVMGMGPITVVQNDSPAEKAGLAPGDLITQLDGKPTALTHDDLSGWTPMTLPEYLHKAALEDREVEITVQRKASGESDSREVSLRIKPVVPIALSTGSPLGAPMAADAIGIAYQITNSVQAVVPSGPASATKIAAGDRVTEAKIIYSADDDGKIAEPITVKLDDEHRSWPGIIDSLQFEPDGTRVELSFLRGDDKEPQKLTIQPKPVEGVYLTARGLQFEPIFRVRKAASFSEAVRYGWEETTDALTMVVRFLQKLGGQVPFKMLGGPGTIAVAAGGAADQGLASLLIFLTMLSANLAVINFLPIPLLDGGHMVFLAYEGIRGRPANEKFVLALHMAGFVFIIGLMIFVIGLDIQRWWPT